LEAYQAGNTTESPAIAGDRAASLALERKDLEEWKKYNKGFWHCFNEITNSHGYAGSGTTPSGIG